MQAGAKHTTVTPSILLLCILILPSCNSDNEVNESTLTGSWRLTGIGGAKISEVSHEAILTLGQGYLFSFHEVIGGRRHGKNGTWQLSMDEEETTLVIQVKDKTELYRVGRRGDKLTLSRVTEPGRRADITFYERYKKPEPDIPLAQRLLAMSPRLSSSDLKALQGISLAILFVFLLIRWSIIKDKKLTILSRWHHLYEDLNESSQEFYESLEEAIRTRGLPGLQIHRIDHREGGIFSAKREYLRARRREYAFDICAAPFGNGFFFSWWLGERPSALWAVILLIPFLGSWLLNTFRPYTYYRLDTATMFQDSVHSAVLEVIDQVTKAKGLRQLSESERKPVMTELFNR